MIPLQEDRREEFIKNLQDERRILFVVEKSNPRISFDTINHDDPVLLHPRYITSHGPERFRWEFEDQDGVDFRGTVRWGTAMFMGEYSPTVQESFKYGLELPSLNNIRSIMSFGRVFRQAKIGPFFMRSPHVRKGKFQNRYYNSRITRGTNLVAFPDEVSAILAAGLLHSSR